jgi:hypothetical protein
LYPFTPAVTGYKVGDWVKLRIKPRHATNIRRGEVVCIDQVQDDYLRFVNPNLNPALVLWARRQFLRPHEVFPCEPPVVEAAETSPGVKTQATVSESVIAPAAKTSLDAESDRNSILTGIPLSDKFLARYSPPQSEFLHYEIPDGYKVHTDGQLRLFEVQVVTEPEPPDPDDFESLDAFREAIARWDWEHPSSLDHFSDSLPSSEDNDVSSEDNDVSSEDNDVSSEDNDVSSEDNALELPLDSFCLWAHCPPDWYEPAALLEPSKVSEVSELSPTCKSSITSDFFIPTFGRWGDRSNIRDEPPDTWIFARLPNQASRNYPETIPKLSRNYPETIPKLFHRVAAGSSTQPARSPPSGDAMS